MTDKPTTKREGRPPSYTQHQITQAIIILEAKGLTPTAPLIKAVLVEDLGVSPGLNVQSLERELVRVLAEREEERERVAIAALPESVRAVARAQAQSVERGLLVAATRVHQDLCRDAGREVEAAHRERRQIAARCEDLVAAAAEDKATIATLRDDVLRLMAERDELATRLVELEKERELERTRQSGQADILAAVRDLLAGGREMQTMETPAIAQPAPTRVASGPG